MSVELNPAIPALDTNSLCYSIYMQLYTNFFNAHDKKDAEHPWGIVEGDEISIRLHNTAYNFADAISSAVNDSGSGGSGEGGVLIDYLKKAGGNMTGLLRSNFGFEAGINNTLILEAYRRTIAEDSVETSIYGIQITGELRVGETDLYVGGENILTYSKHKSLTTLSGNTICLNASCILSKGEFIIGTDKETGVFISPEVLLVNGNHVYHSGNANSLLTDWAMKNGTVSGDLLISGKTILSGKLSAINGFELGVNNQSYLHIGNDGVIHSQSFLSFSANSGIMINSAPVLIRTNTNDVQLGGGNGTLFLGSDQTTKVSLYSDLYDIDGEHKLISKYGSAFFPDGLKIKHNYGDDLMSSYRINSADEGILIYKKLRFGNISGTCLSGDEGQLSIRSSMTLYGTVYDYNVVFRYGPSTSIYRPLNRVSSSLFIDTNADFFTFGRALEAKNFLGVEASPTRLSNGHLFLTGNSFLQAGTDGIKHYGNSYFLGNISSEKFSSGLSGSGWAISKNQTTGNVSATFDELTIRKKMRVYEMEVEKQNITNGSLWVSDSCSGDQVIPLY